MPSAQLESGSTNKVVHTRPSHGQHIDPFTNTSKALVLQFHFMAFRVLPRFHQCRIYQGRLV
jgi:hypothetical protein